MASQRPAPTSAPYTNFYTPENANFYAAFRYLPLNKENEEIRLIEVDTSGAGFHKMVHAVPLDTVGMYSAISYHSGNPNDTAPISIDGVTMNIFANLAYGIKSAISFWGKEYPQKALRLWVDQICINQSDLAEKSHQVNFMREIYRRAAQVYVSMPVEEDIQPAFQWLTSLSTRLSKGYEPPANMLYQNIPSQDRRVPESPRWPAPVWDQVYRVLGHSWWSRSWVYQEFIVASRVFFLFSVEHSISWEELHPLLSLFLKLDTLSACETGVKTRDWVDKAKERYTYFTNTGLMERTSSRMIAELFCDNEIYDCDGSDVGACDASLKIYCSPCFYSSFVIGTALLSTASAVIWAAGCGFFRWSFCPGYDVRRTQASREGLQEHLRRLSSMNLARTLVGRVIQDKIQWQSQDHTDLSSLLHHARNTETSNPKDKVYAFLGLAHPRYAIPINYDPSYSMNTMLSDVARAIIKHEDAGLDILSQAGTATHNRRLPQGSDVLPTWVPDWETKEDSGGKFIEALELPPNCAAGASSMSFVSFLEDRFGHPGRVLRVMGIMLAILGTPLPQAHEGFKPCRSYQDSGGRFEIRTTSIALPGDELWILYGMNWPVVLRRSSTRGTTALLAIAMVRKDSQAHDIMFGSNLKGKEGQVIIV